MRVIFIFIDGFGLGETDSAKNPIAASNTPGLDYIFKNAMVIPTDATLGVKGLPQSATGQTAIFTGKNASKVLGRHLNGRPTITLRKLINEDNLFMELVKMGYSITNANVYRDEYLVKMLDTKDRRNSPSVTSVMTMAAGIKFRTSEDFEKGLGVYHDITGQILQESGYDVTVITPREAAGRLNSLSLRHDFTLYEHFLTDIIGHKMDMKGSIAEIEMLDSFLAELVKQMDFEKQLLIITSDHGNIEDISVKTHTYNKVPTIIMGKLPEGIRINIASLTDIMPFILDVFRASKDSGNEE